MYVSVLTLLLVYYGPYLSLLATTSEHDISLSNDFSIGFNDSPE